MYTIDENNKVFHDGKPVATIISEHKDDTEIALRLVSLANLGVRDEAFLDKLGEKITQRNVE